MLRFEKEIIIMNLSKLKVKPFTKIYHLFSEDKQYYKILKVKPNATPEEIKASYYSLVKLYHPDVVKTNSNKIKVINEAYSVLSHEESRRKYDAEIMKQQKNYQANHVHYSTNERSQSSRRRRRNSQDNMDRDPQPQQKQPKFTNFSSTLFFNFAIGMVFTFIMILIFGRGQTNRQRIHHPPPPPQSSNNSFQEQMQRSLMKGSRSQQLS